MHYFQFNIGDYASHTSRLTPLEDLAYRRMLDLYYLNEQPLNGCITDVARELGLSEHVNEVKYVLGKFFTETEIGFSQKRIDLEIKKYKSNAKNKSKAGKASAKARAAKASSKVTGVEQTLNTTPTNVEQNIKHKPLTKNQEPLNSLVTIDRFAEFWNLYGKKVDSAKCKTKFSKLSKSDIELIFESLPAYINSKPDKQYRKNPITWLNGKCWNDEVISNERTQINGQKLSAHERVKQRNDAKYRQPDQCRLGLGANDGHLGRAVDEGERGTTIEHVDNKPFLDY